MGGLFYGCDMWIKFKRRARAAWHKTRAWFIALLVSLGLLTAIPLEAQTIAFTYTPANSRVDGTPMLLSEISETRLYCDGALASSELGADGDIDADLTIGTHTCHATHVDTDGQESLPSNVVTKIVLPGLPGSPSNLS